MAGLLTHASARRLRIAVLRDLVRRGWRPPARLALTDDQADRLLDDIATVSAAPFPSGARPRDEALTLTESERRVLTLAASGLTKAEIAAALRVGEETVKTQVASARGRFGARNITHAVALAVSRGDVFVSDEVA